MSNKLVSVNIAELKPFINHIIKNNRFLQEQGKPVVSIEVSGESGIGKTSVIKQIAEENNLSFVKLNLAQIEEVGDLVGFPIRQFEIKKGDDVKWVDENVLDNYFKNGYESNNKNRMSYCAPEWIADKEKGGILLLDDWNRADLRFIQAVMELVDRQEYISWKLPKDWHIILTSNPDNGNYIVNTIDNAQKTRFITVNLTFDVECWAEWAEKNSIDSRCINFLLLNPELINENINSRSVTMFFNSISSIENFESELPLIQLIGEGSVGSEFASMFSIFINNKLDKLISPKDIMTKNEDYVINIMKSLVGKDDKNYRADIASTLATRIVNWVTYYVEKGNKLTKNIVDRISKLITEEIFTPDIRYNLVKNIYLSNPTEFKLMLMNKNLIKFIIEK